MGILHQILPPQIHLLDVLNHAVLLRRLRRNARRRGYLSGRHGKLPGIEPAEKLLHHCPDLLFGHAVHPPFAGSKKHGGIARVWPQPPVLPEAPAFQPPGKGRDRRKAQVSRTAATSWYPVDW